MIIAGIDPALTRTGYGVISVRHSKIALVEAGIIGTSAKETLPQRLDTVYRAIEGLLRDTRAEAMVLEKIYAHYRHPATSYLLGHARGVICRACAAQGIPLIEYAATRVKKAIVGNGLASKFQVQRMVLKLLGVSDIPRYTDVTDALALAIAHHYIKRI